MLIMRVFLKGILSSMRGVFLPYRGNDSIIPGGRIRIHDFSYYDNSYDRKHLKNDITIVSSDFKRATKEAKSKFQSIK